MIIALLLHRQVNSCRLKSGPGPTLVAPAADASADFEQLARTKGGLTPNCADVNGPSD